MREVRDPEYATTLNDYALLLEEKGESSGVIREAYTSTFQAAQQSGNQRIVQHSLYNLYNYFYGSKLILEAMQVKQLILKHCPQNIGDKGSEEELEEQEGSDDQDAEEVEAEDAAQSVLECKNRTNFSVIEERKGSFDRQSLVGDSRL